MPNHQAIKSQPLANNQAIINHLLSLEAWAKGFLEETRKTRRLLEAADVSTTANDSMDEQVVEAVTKLRQRIIKKQKG